jgi:multiple sugar transport system substrate-binding protein
MKRQRLWLVVPVALALIATTCSSSSTSTSSGGATGIPSGVQINLTMWMGYTPPPPVDQSQEYLSIQDMVKRFEAKYPNVHIDIVYQNNDTALPKLTAALSGGEQPDISYQYGTNMAKVAQTSKVVDLTQLVQDPSVDWNDFFQGERDFATVNGKILGVPALVDNLAIVYNKDLFAKAGLKPPTPDWTWDDVRADAKAITDRANNVWGMLFPADATETMVWQYEAMLWEAGGDILNADNTQAVFNSPAGVRAATMLQQINQDGSLYLDPNTGSGQYLNLFNDGHIGMLLTGPWDLSGIPDANYGVEILPSFDPGGAHTTIAGPDNWVIFDNGPDRVNTAWEFVKFMTSPENALADSLATGHLPTRTSVEQSPQFAQFDKNFPSIGTYVDNLANLTKARPQIIQYPDVSRFLGLALVSILEEDASPQDALNKAADQANAALAIPT